MNVPYTLKRDRANFNTHLAPLLKDLDGMEKDRETDSWNELENYLRTNREAMHDFYRDYVNFPHPNDRTAVRNYIEQRFQLAKELMAKGEYPEALFHLTNAVASYQRNCYYQPVVEYRPFHDSTPEEQIIRRNIYIDYANQRRDDQLKSWNLPDDTEDGNYDDGEFLYCPTYAGDEKDVSAAAANILEGSFPPFHKEAEIKKIYRTEMGLFQEAHKQEGKKYEAAAHLVKAMICKCDHPLEKWPAELRYAFNQVKGRSYVQDRLLRIAQAKRHYLEDYDSMLYSGVKKS